MSSSRDRAVALRSSGTCGYLQIKLVNWSAWMEESTQTVPLLASYWQLVAAEGVTVYILGVYGHWYFALTQCIAIHASAYEKH